MVSAKTALFMSKAAACVSTNRFLQRKALSVVGQLMSPNESSHSEALPTHPDEGSTRLCRLFGCCSFDPIPNY